MTEFTIGQRVIVNGEHDGQKFVDEPGTVAARPDWLKNHTCIRFDQKRAAFHDGHKGDNRHHWFFAKSREGYTISPAQVGPSTYLNGLDALSALVDPDEPGRFITAFKDGPDFNLTGDNCFNSRRAAEDHANNLAANMADVTVVVLKCVSQHSSRIVVTTEML